MYQNINNDYLWIVGLLIFHFTTISNFFSNVLSSLYCFIIFVFTNIEHYT